MKVNFYASRIVKWLKENETFDFLREHLAIAKKTLRISSTDSRFGESESSLNEYSEYLVNEAESNEIIETEQAENVFNHAKNQLDQAKNQKQKVEDRVQGQAENQPGPPPLRYYKGLGDRQDQD